MALKPKTPIFKSINGEMDLGGAPIYADDLVRIQENNRGDILNYFEANRRLLPSLMYYAGSGNPPVKSHENGLILSGLEYDNTNPAAPVISEGYILSGGEVCYYPGGTLTTGLTNPGLLYLYKGAPTYTARTFSVGGSKDILVTHSVVIEQTSLTGVGFILPALTGITATDEVVVLQVGIGQGTGEQYFSMRAALDISPIGSQLSQNVWVAASMVGAITVDSQLGYCVSRVNKDRTTEIRGSVNVPVASLVGTSPSIITLNSLNVNTASPIVIDVKCQEVATDLNRGSVNASGDVKIFEPLAGFGATDLTVIFNVVFLGDTVISTPYVYDNNYLNIT
jgi:hypothetical protein